MTDVRNFGNPDNPFDEPDNELLRDRLILDPIRSIVSGQIKLMTARPAEVIVSERSEGIFRNLRFTCHAPFSPSYGMYINESALVMGTLGALKRIEADITLGDSLIDGIATHWATMTGPDAVPFAITGISREEADGSFEKWDAVTIRTRLEDGAITSELWAQPTGASYTERRPVEGSFNHFAAINKAVLAQVERL